MRTGSSPFHLTSVGPNGELQQVPWDMSDDPSALIKMLSNARDQRAAAAAGGGEGRAKITETAEAASEPSSGLYELKVENVEPAASA